jgi:hypothetical protein
MSARSAAAAQRPDRPRREVVDVVVSGAAAGPGGWSPVRRPEVARASAALHDRDLATVDPNVPNGRIS